MSSGLYASVVHQWFLGIMKLLLHAPDKAQSKLDGERRDTLRLGLYCLTSTILFLLRFIGFFLSITTRLILVCVTLFQATNFCSQRRRMVASFCMAKYALAWDIADAFLAMILAVTAFIPRRFAFCSAFVNERTAYLIMNNILATITSETVF